MTGVISAVVALAVLLFAMINAKIFNVIHGFITFFGTAICLKFIWFVSNGSFQESFGNVIDGVDKYIVGFLTNSLSLFHIPSNIINTEKWYFYIIGIGIWIISFILAVAAKSAKKRK